VSHPTRARLGRGLGALLGEGFDQPLSSSGEIRTLELTRIAPNPLQPRREFREEELAELRASIRENGLLQPLLVRPAPGSSGDRYQLVAGERRFRAVTELGWSEVPVVVREMEDRTLLVLALVENLQREALSPLEEAEGYQLLSTEFGLTQGEIAEAVGKQRATVSNTLRLLRLPPTVRQLLERGALSMGHARALLSLEDPIHIAEMARRATEEGWSVREVEARAREFLTRASGRKQQDPTRGAGAPNDRVTPVHRAIQEALQEALSTRVALRTRKGGSGVIEVPYTSDGELERLFLLLTGEELGKLLD